MDVQSLPTDKDEVGIGPKIYSSNMAAISEQNEPSNSGDAEAERPPESPEMTRQAEVERGDKSPETVGQISDDGDASTFVEEKGRSWNAVSVGQLFFNNYRPGISRRPSVAS